MANIWVCFGCKNHDVVVCEGEMMSRWLSMPCVWSSWLHVLFSRNVACLVLLLCIIMRESSNGMLSTTTYGSQNDCSLLYMGLS